MASQEKVFEGSVPISQLSRLSEILAEVDGDVDLELAFSKGNQDRTQISGNLQATVALICQNCMQIYRQALVCQIDLAVVGRKDDMDELDESTDSLVCTDRELALRDLVEDELILCVPMIPRHPDQCPDSEFLLEQEIPALEEQTTHRPFAELAEAMKKQEKPES